MFFPTEENMPFPLKWIDVPRVTYTNLSSQGESWITDYWPNALPRELSDEWTGKVIFYLLRPDPGPKHEWADGRLTKKKAGGRPGNMWVEAYQNLSKNQTQKAREQWAQEEPLRAEARRIRGRAHLPKEEIEEFTKVIAEKRLELSLPAVPAMPLRAVPRQHNIGVCSNTSYRQAPSTVEGNLSPAIPHGHVDNIADQGNACKENFAMVHQAVPQKDIYRDPKSRAAVEEEKDKLDRKNAWLYNTVEEYESVRERAIRQGQQVHFGNVMAICQIKNAQMAPKHQRHKGRMVFQGG